MGGVIFHDGGSREELKKQTNKKSAPSLVAIKHKNSDSPN